MCWCTVLLESVKVKLPPQLCETDRYGRFLAALAKLQQFVISETDKVHHQSRAAIQQLSAPAATSQFVLAAYYDVSITSRVGKNIELTATFC